LLQQRQDGKDNVIVMRADAANSDAAWLIAAARAFRDGMYKTLDGLIGAGNV
jgi:hypothetical protein